MANIFVVGLGGTGIKVLQHLKPLLISQRGGWELLGLDTVAKPDIAQDLFTGTAGLLSSQQLDTADEFFSLRGDCDGWICGNADKGIPSLPKNSVVARWLDVLYFSQYQRPALNVSNGAGMHRQIGRLSLFNHLQMGLNSPLYGLLETKIRRLEGDITFIVSGSLAGGTGASLFIDIAHLVTKIAKANQRNVPALYGMLVLPKAFSHTPPVNVDGAMLARSTAALRELCRMITPPDPELGYLMPYTDGVRPGANALHQRVEGRLFRIVYLFETRNKPQNEECLNPLDVRLEHGVAPTVAQWIRTLKDEVTGNALALMLANRDVAATALTDGYANHPLADSVGTYSVMLPRQEILETWKAHLAQLALDLLVPILPDGSLDPAQAGGKRGNEGRLSAEAYWSTHPAPAACDVGKNGKTFQDENQTALLEAEIADRTEEFWKGVLRPTTATEQETKAYDSACKRFFYNFAAANWPNNPLKDAIVQIEDPRRHGNSRAQAAQALIGACEREETTLLTNLRTTVTEWSKSQLAEFRQALREKTDLVLNGPPEKQTLDNALENRAGKLGWLLSLVRQLANNLANAQLRYQAARAQLSIKLGITQLKQTIEAGSNGKLSLQTAMEREEKKQQDYLQARQRLLVWKRRDLLLDHQIQLVSDFQTYTDELVKALSHFANTLRSGTKANLYKSLVEYGGEVHNPEQTGAIGQSRTQLQTVLAKVREVVPPSDWEKKLFDQVISQSNGEPNVTATMRILQDFHWEVSEYTAKPGTAQHYQAPQVHLRLEGYKRTPNSSLADYAINVVAQSDDTLDDKLRVDFDRLLARCEVEVKPWPERLCILGYLEDHWRGHGAGAGKTPGDFATHLLAKCDAVLRFPSGVANLGMAFVVTRKYGQPEAHRNWLTALGGIIKARNTTNAQSVADILESDDDCTLTLLVYKGLSSIWDLGAYTDGLRSYGDVLVHGAQNEMSRRHLHIFAAEQQALLYDQAPARGNILPARVVALLEDLSRFENFIKALALGVIVEQPIVGTDGATLAFARCAEIPPRVSDRDELGREITAPLVWTLNALDKPNIFENRPTSYLQAAETFCLRLRAYPNPASRELNDLYERLAENLPVKLQAEIDRRLPNWEAGNTVPEVKTALALPAGPNRQRALQAVAWVELLQALSLEFDTHLKILNDIGREGVAPVSVALQQMKNVERSFIMLAKSHIVDEIKKHQAAISRK